jgi:hypothetical protein
MTITIDAIYVDGMLKPLTPLNLDERQLVKLQVVIPDQPRHQPAPEEVSFAGSWPADLGLAAQETIAEIRAQTNTKLARLANEPMPPPETITMRGLWSHVDPADLTQALAEVRTATNRRLQQLIDEV